MNMSYLVGDEGKMLYSGENFEHFLRVTCEKVFAQLILKLADTSL